MASTITPSTLMVLSIRTLEHQTKPVTISRDASVLDLKRAVQGAFHVESNRQRLIFQGKMMKDGQSLTEYASLDTGKVVHLVVRPLDVSQNPQNDDPRPQRYSNMRTFARGIPLSRFPFGRGPLPMVDGYTLITLDVGGDRGTPPSSSLMDGLFPSSASPPPPPLPSTQTRPNHHDTTSRATTMPSQNNSNNTNSSPIVHRLPVGFNLRPRLTANDFGFLSATSSTGSSTTSQLPASVEIRLMRSMSCIRNVRSILDTPSDQSIIGLSTPSTTLTSREQAREIRTRIRSYGNSQPAAVGMVLDELATLMTDIVPRLRETTEVLRANDQALESEGSTDSYRCVLRTARVVQGMSLISHFLGSVLAAAEVSPHNNSGSGLTTTRTEDRRSRTGATTVTTATSRSHDNPSSGTVPEHSSPSQTSQSPSNEESSQRREQRRGTKRSNDDDDGACSQPKKGKNRDDS